ncbi:MAG: HAMP domain-containing sensor histidine kinase [Eubacteriales bacterium]|nr:HAMP domain-containing sensor histidine kinase [Eubacteriales bacterium]
MIKKVRRRFVFTGMAAAFTIAMTLVLSLNLVNRYFTDQRLGEALNEIAAVWQEDESTDSIQGLYSNQGLYSKEEGLYSNQGIYSNENIASAQQQKGRKGNSGNANNRKMKNRSGRQGAFTQYQGRVVSIFLTDEGQVFVNGNNQDLLSGIDPEDLLEKVQRSGKTEGYLEDFRFLVQEQDGGRRFLFLDCFTEIRAQRTLWIISFVLASAGMVAAFFFIYYMSGKSIRPLEESIEKQKRFITDAGHELKTPLSVISTNMDILSLDLGENEWVDGTKRQVKGLRKLVARLITLSRMEEAQYIPAEDHFCLSSAVEECATPFAEMASSKGKYLHQELEEDLFTTGDESAVRQLITILIDNAVKYALPEKEILVRLFRDGRKIRFETRNAWDHSTPATELDRLFDRFYRADASRNRSDTQGSYGLGLPIAQAIAEKNKLQLIVFEDSEGLLVFRAVFQYASAK